MADINPLLFSIVELRYRIESGESIRASLPAAMNSQSMDWNTALKRWQIAIEHGSATDKIVSEINSPYRRAFLETLGAGLSGSPIYQSLIELEGEVRAACELEIEREMKKLPFLSMLPVLLLMFPAFLLLLLGPVVNQLFQELSK